MIPRGLSGTGSGCFLNAWLILKKESVKMGVMPFDLQLVSPDGGETWLER